MRSHAKASTAGSNRQQATKLVLPASLFATLVALVVVVGSASAANGVVNFFGGNGVEGGKFASASSGPGGVAVNQAGSGGATAGDVYVVDRGNRRVQQFTAAGTFVRAFGKDVGGAGVDVCEVAVDCVAATASEAAGAMNNPQGIAIDQTNGNVFVSDQSNRRIDVFSAEGAFQAAFGYGVDTGAAALELCTTASTCAAGASGANAGQFGAQIGYPAIAPAGSPNAGDLYVGNKSNRRVDQFDIELTGSEVTGVAFVKGWGWGVDDGASEFQQCTTASVCQAPNTSSPTSNPGQFSANQPQAIAIDSNGNAYTAESAGNSRAQKFDASGSPAAFNGADLAGSPGPIDIAVDPTNDHVFGLKEPSGAGEKRVLELNAAGAFIATHASGTTISSANSLAVVNGTTNFYLSTNQSPEFRGVFVLATKVNPTASTEAPSPLGSHTATLKGKVNPKGFTTTYRFEFSRDGGSTWEKYPAEANKEVNLGSGEADIPVEQEVSGLIGGNSYRYKIVATKPFGAGTATSNTTTFSAPASAPTVAAFTTVVTDSSAVLAAEIRPENQATTYHFEYGTADCASNPCTSVPTTDSGIGSGAGTVTVAKEISGLNSGTTYHFRVVATNGTGTTEGPDETFITYEDLEPDTSCPNQANRYGHGANLPDCRAYEMVSPVDKNGGDIRGAGDPNARRTEYIQASVNGDAITFTSYKAFAGARTAHYANQYIARRGAAGWTTQSISPERSLPNGFQYEPSFVVPFGQFKAFTADLSQSWFTDTTRTPLVPDALGEFIPNLYGRDTGTGALSAVTMGEPVGYDKTVFPALEAYTPDGSRVLFSTIGGLTPDSAGNKKSELYLHHDGGIELVSTLPGGEADPGWSYAGFGGGAFEFAQGVSQVEHAISDDGSRVFWRSRSTGHNFPGDLYVWIDGEGTVAISTGSEAGFWLADGAGSKAIYGEGEAGGGVQTEELFEFHVDTEVHTPIAGQVVGVVGASEDLSHLYFVSKEDLAAGAVAGGRNLYLRHEGTLTFIATLDPTDNGERSQPDSSGIVGPPGGTSTQAIAAKEPRWRSSRVSADGKHMAFMSNRSLTGYDNTDQLLGVADMEVFVYDAEAGNLSCVSCRPSGARPVGEALAGPYRTDGQKTSVWAAAWLSTGEHSLNQSRPLSSDGKRVFFNSYDALVPGDTNGAQDVYQWEAPGSGGCEVGGPGYSEVNEGCVSLISTGKSPEDSEFLDATPSGDDVFIRTESGIDPRDTYGRDVYNARVGGGYPPPPVPPAACVGDACQVPPVLASPVTPASAAFRGAGDPAARRSCAVQGKRAAKLSRRAKRLRRAARRSSAQKSKRLRQRSVRMAKRAQRISRSAKRCRRANRRAGR